MAALTDKLSALATSSPAQLRDAWAQTHDGTAPRLPVEAIKLALAYRLQEQNHGGLSTVALRELRRIGGGSGLPTLPRLKPGTRLMRSWRGRDIVVLVTEDGFLFERRTYASLSRIARDITGTAWSGPRFFGLRSTGIDRG